MGDDHEAMGLPVSVPASADLFMELRDQAREMFGVALAGAGGSDVLSGEMVAPVQVAREGVSAALVVPEQAEDKKAFLDRIAADAGFREGLTYRELCEWAKGIFNKRKSSDINPLLICVAVRKVRGDRRWDLVSEMMGVRSSDVWKYYDVLDLPSPVLRAVETGCIALTTAFYLRNKKLSPVFLTQVELYLEQGRRMTAQIVKSLLRDDAYPFVCLGKPVRDLVVGGLPEALAARDAEADSDEQSGEALVARDARIVELEKELAARDAEIAKLRAELAFRVEEVGVLSGRVTKRNRQIVELKKKFARLKERFLNADALLKDIKGGGEALIQQLLEMRATFIALGYEFPDSGPSGDSVADFLLLFEQVSVIVASMVER